MKKSLLLISLLLILYCFGFQNRENLLTKEESECCVEEKQTDPKLHYMREHKHIPNPKITKLWNSISNVFTQWVEKNKTPPFTEPEESDYKFIKEENAKIDETLARIKDNEMLKKIKTKKQKKAFPIDLDVVLNDKLNITKPLENFTSGRLAKVWGYGPRTVGKNQTILDKQDLLQKV